MAGGERLLRCEPARRHFILVALCFA